jgi:hypothetical protein
MKSDALDGFTEGLASFWVRFPLALLIIAAGFALPARAFDSDSSISLVSTLWLWPLVAMGMVFVWAEHGLWGFLGISLLIAVVTLSYAFIQNWRSRWSGFLLFSASTVYFFPLCLEERRWVVAAAIYLGVSTVYGLLCIGYARMVKQ